MRRTRTWPDYWHLAAGFAIFAVAALAVVLFVWLRPSTVTVRYGDTQTVELSDGSIAELGSGSTLTYRNFLGRDERRVTLEGEAFFDVAAAERPFIVETFNASITVLGTRFNVRAWADDPIPETSVALESGRVAVAPLQAPDDATAAETSENAPVGLQADETEESMSGESAAARRADDGLASATSEAASTVVVLEPGQTTSVVRDSAAVRPPAPIRLDHVTAWRSGGLASIDQPVGAVFNTIERRFDVVVQVTDPAIENRLLTYLNPNPRSAEDVLSDICHTLDLHYRHTANGFEILPSDSP